jgi:hypothetical protein
MQFISEKVETCQTSKCHLTLFSIKQIHCPRTLAEIGNETQKTEGENINVAIKRKKGCERAIERKIWLIKILKERNPFS